MSPYDKKGFLGSEIERWNEENVERHKEIFSLAESLNADCYSALEKARPNNKNRRQLLACCLFPRSMELFQGVYLLAARGMIPSSNVLLRTLIEAMFSLVAVANDDSALEAFILNYELERLRVVNKVINDKNRLFSNAQVDLAKKLKTQLKDDIDKKSIKKFKTEDFARKAGLHDWYVTAYSVTSGSVHTSLRDIEKYLIQDGANNITSLQFIPSDEGVVAIMATACNSLGLALTAFLTVLGQDTTICAEHAVKLKPFLEQLLE